MAGRGGGEGGGGDIKWRLFTMLVSTFLKIKPEKRFD